MKKKTALFSEHILSFVFIRIVLQLQNGLAEKKITESSGETYADIGTTHYLKVTKKADAGMAINVLSFCLFPGEKLPEGHPLFNGSSSQSTKKSE